jgi:hypothetical protein
MESTRGKRALCGVIDDIGPTRGQVGEVFDYLAQLNEEDRARIIDEVLDETLKPFTDIDFKPDEHNYFISLNSDWRIKKEED